MSLLDRITERTAELTTRAEQLRKELADTEYELGRLETAGQVVAQLLAEEQQPTAGGLEKPPVARVMIPHRAQAQGPHALPADYQRLLAAVTDKTGPVRCRQLCEQLGLGTEPRHVEAVRAKLKRLEDRGWLHRNGAGAFHAAT